MSEYLLPAGGANWQASRWFSNWMNFYELNVGLRVVPSVHLKLFSWQTLDIPSPGSEHIPTYFLHFQVTLENLTVLLWTDSLFSVPFCGSCILHKVFENKKVF